jgi:hypothetical protein
VQRIVRLCVFKPAVLQSVWRSPKTIYDASHVTESAFSSPLKTSNWLDWVRDPSETFLGQDPLFEKPEFPTDSTLTQNTTSGSNSQSPYSKLIINYFLFLGFEKPGSPKLHISVLLHSDEQQNFRPNYYNSSNKIGLWISHSSWQRRVYTLYNRLTYDWTFSYRTHT